MFVPHPDYPEVDRTVRGGIGPVQVGFNSTVSGWCHKFVKACINAGIPSTHDFNAPKGLIGAARVCLVTVQHNAWLLTCAIHRLVSNAHFSV